MTESSETSELRIGLLVTGAILLLIGGVWTGQGANLIGGSFMTRSSMWLMIGLATVLVGVVLLCLGAVGYRRWR